MAGIDVDDFALGNGSADDTIAIKKAIQTGRDLSFTRGKTYLYSGMLVLQPGQVVYGNGATLKRRAQVSTAVTSIVAAGETRTIEVAEPERLGVGMDIALRAGDRFDRNNRTIASIDGNRVTVSLPFGISATSGAQVTSSWHGIWFRDDCRVYDVVMDGNRANYDWATWDNTHEFHMQGVRSLASGCELRELPGEGIYLERDHIVVTDCALTNVNGNGLHLGASNRSLIDAVRVVNANLDPRMGHADGCVTLSAAVDHLTVRNCHLENGLSGVASWDQRDNSNLSILDNTIVACRTSALEGWCPATDAPFNVVIAGNRIYDSKSVFIKSTSAWSETTAFPNHIVFRGNYVRNTKIDVTGARHLVVSGNVVEDPGDRDTTAVSIEHTEHVVARGNQVAGGRYGIVVAGESNDVVVEGNTLAGQSHGAIALNTAGRPNCQVLGNSISADAGADPAYRGIAAGAKHLVRENTVSIESGEAGIYAAAGALVKDNVVRAGAAAYSIRAAPGSSGVLIKDNEVTAPVSNGGGGNLEAGTVIVPS